MKTLLITCILALFVGQATIAQTAWKPDWRTYSIEEVIDLTKQGMRGGWTYGKLEELFGQPDKAVSVEDFREQEAGMVYELKSGLILRITKYKDTKTKRFGQYYFATFELIDPQYEEGDSTIWTENYCRPLTEAEQKEFQKRMKEGVENPRYDYLPPTDIPPSNINDGRS